MAVRPLSAADYSAGPCPSWLCVVWASSRCVSVVASRVQSIAILMMVTRKNLFQSSRRALLLGTNKIPLASKEISRCLPSILVQRPYKNIGTACIGDGILRKTLPRVLHTWHQAQRANSQPAIREQRASLSSTTWKTGTRERPPLPGPTGQTTQPNFISTDLQKREFGKCHAP